MKLKVVVVGKKYRIKDTEKVDPEYRGVTGVVVEKGDVFSDLTQMMIAGDKEGVKFKDGLTSLARDIKPAEEVEVGDTVKIKDSLEKGILLNGYVNDKMAEMAGRKAKVVDNCPHTRTSFRLDIDNEKWGWTEDMLEVVEEEVLEEGNEITDSFHTGELIKKFDEEDYYGKDAVLKFYDENDDLTYRLINLDLFEPVDKAKENLEEGDEFIVNYIFSGKVIYTVWDKGEENDGKIVYFAKSENGEMEVIEVDEIDELV